jgi:hypothetical protein
MAFILGTYKIVPIMVKWGGLQSIGDFYQSCSPWDNDLKLIIYNMLGPRFCIDWRGQFVLVSYCDMIGYP